MPNPSDYDSQKDWMAACVPTRIDEGEEQDQAVAVCLSIWRKHTGQPEPKAANTGELMAYGGALKTLGKGKVGGYLVRYTTEADPDLERDFFTAETWYGPHKTTPVFYHHGEDGKLHLKRLADEADIEDDEFGKWVETQLDLRDRYERFIYEQADAGKMGWSSGTAPHLIEREKIGKAWWIKTWPLGVDASMTPTPMEPRNKLIAYKSFMKSLADALGVWLADEAEAEPEATQVAASVAERRIYVIQGASNV